MSFRRFIDQANASGDLVVINKAVDPRFEVANVAHALEGRPVLFNHVKDYPGWRICAGACADRRFFRMDLEVPVPDLMHRLADAISHPG